MLFFQKALEDTFNVVFPIVIGKPPGDKPSDLLGDKPVPDPPDDKPGAPQPPNKPVTPPPPKPVPTTFTKISGDGQSAETNQHLSDILVVRVLDQNGNGMAGVSVTFSVDPTDGTLGATTVTTAANGRASTSLRLGDTAGTYTVTASVTGLTDITFTATATDPPPPPRPTTLHVISGHGQTAQEGEILPRALVVQVDDQNGNPLSGIEVTFSVTPNDGVLGATTVITGSNGRASTTLQLGNTPGRYTVAATIAALTGRVTFFATATPLPKPTPPKPTPPNPVPTTLEKVSGDGQTGSVNQLLPDALYVRVLDQDGNALSGVDVDFSVSPSDGVLSATRVTTASDGQAGTILELGNTVGAYTVTASVTNLTSVRFTAKATPEVAPSPPTPRLIPDYLGTRRGDRQSNIVGRTLPCPLVAMVVDEDNNPVPGIEVRFSVTPDDGVLADTSDVTGSNGEASTTLQLGQKPGRYIITASADGLKDATWRATARAALPAWIIIPTNPDNAYVEPITDENRNKHVACLVSYVRGGRRIVQSGSGQYATFVRTTVHHRRIHAYSIHDTGEEAERAGGILYDLYHYQNALD